LAGVQVATPEFVCDVRLVNPAATESCAYPARGARQTVLSALATDGRGVLLLALFGIGALLLLAVQLTQDGWLAMVAGRVVAEHGIPQTDTLTTWTLGHVWVDQQWLGQLLIYEAAHIGGVKLALLLNSTVAIGTATGAFIAARRLGGTPRTVTLVAVVTLPFVAVGTWHLRTQTLAAPLFLAVLWLLAADRRRPSSRVFFVFPLLGLWSNIHGSVVLGSLLVFFAGAAFLGESRRASGHARHYWQRHGLALLFAGVPPLFMTPYGASIVSYYEHTILNSGFGMVVTEWQKTTFSPATLPFFLAAGLTLWVLGRSRERLDIFASLALVTTMAAALLAMRNLVWFSLVALVLVPGALDSAVGARRANNSVRRLDSVIPAAAAMALVITAAVVATRPATRVERDYPKPVADAVARAARANPHLHIYASEKYADWLLWRHPELAGRIAFDARFELLSHRQLTRTLFFNLQVGSAWRRAATGAGLLVLNRAKAPGSELIPTADVLARDPGVRRLAMSGDAVVLRRPAAG
jgi:hypothetical protein